MEIVPMYEKLLVLVNLVAPATMQIFQILSCMWATAPAFLEAFSLSKVMDRFASYGISQALLER